MCAMRFVGSCVRCAGLLAVCSSTVLGAAEWHPGPGCRFIELPVPKSGKPGFTLLPPGTTGVWFSNSIPESVHLTNQILLDGSGVAAGDVDGDGRCDLYFCHIDGPNVLYRNLGNWKFEDITESAGVACAGQYSTGAVLADIDGDGDLDLLVNSIGGGTRCFFNDGLGRFTELKESRLVRRFGSTSM